MNTILIQIIEWRNHHHSNVETFQYFKVSNGCKVAYYDPKDNAEVQLGPDNGMPLYKPVS